MPVVLRLDGFKFLFYANEGMPREPMHIHVKLGRYEAKFWLQPTVVLAYNRGLDRHMLNRVERMVQEHRDFLESAWNGYFA